MDQVTQIREKIDLVSFISEFITLKKAGRNFKAVCPFHNEKSASFMISPERQIWHCFGCGKGGDAFTFLMEYENMEFPEALRVLAKKAGIELQESSFKKGIQSEKEKIFEINKISLKFYKYILNEHKAGLPALQYLTSNRGLALGTIESFDIGFAPSHPSALSDYLIKKKKFLPKDLITAGVSFQKGASVLDFFRGRVMFPLYDHRGNILGFSGRALNDEVQPKYINTKETSVYHKGSVFFGLNLSKEEIKEKENVLLVEGEFDMISLFINGVKNVVAIKGTALTEDQVNLIARFTPKVTFCFDSDSAGFEATKRSLATIEKKGLSANIIDLKDAKDPDEALAKDPNFFKKALKEAPNVYDFIIDKYTSDQQVKTAEGKKVISNELLPLLANISNEIVKEHYIKKLSKEFDVSIESIEKEIGKIQGKKEEDKIVLPEKKAQDRREVLEEYLLSILVQNSNPKNLIKDLGLEIYQFKNIALGKIYKSIVEYSKPGEFDLKSFSNYLSTELLKTFDFLYLHPLPKFENGSVEKKELHKVSTEMNSLFLKDKLKDLTEKIKVSEKEHNSDSNDKIRKEYSETLKLLKEPRV